eukprot:tig00020806_g14029.t1
MQLRIKYGEEDLTIGDIHGTTTVAMLKNEIEKQKNIPFSNMRLRFHKAQAELEDGFSLNHYEIEDNEELDLQVEDKKSVCGEGRHCELVSQPTSD